MNHKTITDRLADRLADKMAVAGIDRNDLAIADHASLSDKSSARVLVTFDKRLGNPTTSAIANFIKRKFNGRLQAEVATAAIHPGRTSAVSVVVSAARVTRPYTDRRGMTEAIANTLYMDQTIGENWKVEVNKETGAKFLVQVRDEDIGSLLNQARANVATARFSEINTAVAYIMPEVGDRVEFFAAGGLRQGEITKKKGDEFTVIEDDGSTHLINSSNVTKMIRKNPEAQERKEEQMIEALLPTMLDRELTEKMVRMKR